MEGSTRDPRRAAGRSCGGDGVRGFSHEVGWGTHARPGQALTSSMVVRLLHINLI